MAQANLSIELYYRSFKFKFHGMHVALVRIRYIHAQVHPLYSASVHVA